MRLYHNPYSFNARRAVMTALHLKVPVDLVVVDLMSQEHRERLRGVNPNDKIPVLEDGDFVLWESHAIMKYLAEKTPGQTLYPADLRARADVDRWLFWCASHFGPAISILNWEHFVKKMVGAGDPNPAEVARGEREVERFALVLDSHLAGREWISGPRLTLADLSIAAPLMATTTAKISLARYPNIQAWFGRVQALEAWKKTSL
ncbi:glutathione S-transferase family protein [Vitiosangium sp. GDMCC 1.1324]|uniref:glutathione S-transferase family protein n=1 Tax=Vitiosangium sp. (strain GDMCC 1.1324) TaxID=2138576 RepID=UPI000D34F28C|nr:glutathione S-transferase family protein [Vitiosangium sp. GDMCC 1.1324]PTL81534.1 glutathione S-transferase family protein [Vitiosangium sp. GDMCC 1.1324]